MTTARQFLGVLLLFGLVVSMTLATSASSNNAKATSTGCWLRQPGDLESRSPHFDRPVMILLDRHTNGRGTKPSPDGIFGKVTISTVIGDGARTFGPARTSRGGQH